MSTVTLRGPGGKLARVDAPNTGPWAHLGTGWRGLIYDGTDQNDPRYQHQRNGSLLIATSGGAIGLDATKYSGGLDKMAYVKPDGDTSQGFAETWKEHRDTSNGATMLVVEYGPGFGGDDGPFFGFPFAVSSAGESGFLRIDQRLIDDPIAGKPFYLSEIVDETGAPWPLVGYSIHTLISSIAKGEDVGPRLDEAVSYGYNTIVEISCHLSSWKTDHGYFYDPRRGDHRDILARLFDICAQKGLRVWHRALADAQDVSQHDQTAIWQSSCDVAHGRWNVINTIGNESAHNGYDPGAFSKPGDTGGVLYSRGSIGGDAVPYLNTWDFAEFESRRDLMAAIRDASCCDLYYGGWPQNPDGFRVPVVNIEPAFFHDTPHDMWGDARWTSPVLARLLGGHIGAGCSGGGFGASDGMECRPLGANAAECARQFARGLIGAFVR